MEKVNKNKEDEIVKNSFFTLSYKKTFISYSVFYFIYIYIYKIKFQQNIIKKRKISWKEKRGKTIKILLHKKKNKVLVRP